ncbi:hypothetical protein I5M27_05185 [Adhaeribacter sp. BT258]|uniref:Uncharacterized protein n=1 Tax=Adhaeribacter terrigena TaxID=2793070 RepID=A0ABS1BZM7_9BACT|nr:hypothetical protein [Adhaeribacter terrigena]MBK0402367.1 hypothetical protein [Adhaeribacter terrigena]
MKKLLAILCFAVLFLQQAFCQDTIIKRNGDEIQGKVKEISATEVRYTRKELPDVMVVLPVTSIFMIRYENGTKEVFQENNPANELQQLPAVSAPARVNAPAPVADKATGENLLLKGRNDANLYYKGYKGAGTATLLTTILFMPAGLVTAIGTSVTPPSRNNLDYPDAAMFSQREYAKGYEQKAKKIKSGKVWKNFGIGFGSLVVLNFIILSANQQ